MTTIGIIGAGQIGAQLARISTDAGYDVVLVEDLCATTSPSFCTDATLYNVRQCFGFTVTAPDLLEQLP